MKRHIVHCVLQQKKGMQCHFTLSEEASRTKRKDPGSLRRSKTQFTKGSARNKDYPAINWLLPSQPHLTYERLQEKSEDVITENLQILPPKPLSGVKVLRQFISASVRLVSADCGCLSISCSLTAGLAEPSLVFPPRTL